MTEEYITFKEYTYLMNRIAYWILTHNDLNQIKFRNIYGYFGQVVDQQTLIEYIRKKGNTLYMEDHLVAEFVECLIYDNQDLSFLPAYVTGSDGTKYYTNTFVSFANRVSAYEVQNGKSPNIVYIKNPDPKPEPVKLYPYITTPGGGKLGQRTGYSCGPHSLMQCIYRLTGIELSESELMAVCGTTSSGTGHDGLETGLAWFNRKYGYNLKMTWKNFSEVGWDKLQEHINNGAVFFHLLYRNQWGHYEVTKDNVLNVLNSLGSSCGNGYCGYIESRSRATQQSYINGISQKSVCIITR